MKVNRKISRITEGVAARISPPDILMPNLSKSKKTDALRILVIVGAGIILTFPVLFYGLPKFGDDSVAHCSWYTHFAKQLWAGDFYPRWLIDMNEGSGSAGLFFYPPVPYYLTALLYPFFFS